MKRYVTLDLGAVAAILVGLVAGAAVLVWLAGRGSAPVSVSGLEKQFGPKRYSEGDEELIIRHFFRDRQYGFFVDVGAGHYVQGSNTYLLERELHWRGIAVDAIADYADDYARHRPDTQFFPLFVSNESDKNADFYYAPDTRVKSSGIRDATAGAGRIVHQQIRTVALNDLLGANSVRRIDFLSMDIELSEPAALAGFDIRQFRPALVCIEAHPPVRDAISAYFDANGYRRLDEYLVVDTRNWYFTPR